VGTALSDALTEQFYAWEKRGRGWQMHPYHVSLEPAFVPFLRFAPNRPEEIDDGRRPSVVGRLVEWWHTRGREVPHPEPSWEEVVQATEPEIDGLDNGDFAALRLRLPVGTHMSHELAEQIVLATASSSPRVAFELVGTEGQVQLQFAAPSARADSLKRCLEAYLPGATLTAEDYLASAWRKPAERNVAIVDFGLREEFMLPLPVLSLSSIDPLLGVASVLAGAVSDEVALFQVLLQAVRSDWAASALRAMSDGEGRAFFADAPETLSLTRQKLSRPLMACVVRVAAKASGAQRAWDLVKSAGRALLATQAGGSNELIPLENEGYDDTDHEFDLINRRTCRSGMLLSSAEVATLVHPPTAAVATEGLRAAPLTTRAAPPKVDRGEILLGTNEHRGRTIDVRLPTGHRLRHVHVVGATGTGKSTLLLHLMSQDLEAGRGFALLDPHGDLADEMLGLVPESRVNDVVLFDPADEEHPIGFNVLEAHSELERELLSSDLVSVFRRFATSWGDQMSAVLGNAIHAFLEHPHGGSLLDLRRFLMEPPFRRDYLAQVADQVIRSFWEHEFPRLAGRSHMSIVTRLDAFLRPRFIRNIVSQTKSRLDIGRLIDHGTVLIARLSQGAIGEQNAHLLGSLMVAKFQQAALARQRLAEGKRRPYYLYLDEFHNFATPSIAGLLSGARKYGLGLVLAHQDLRQLSEHEIRSAVFANAGTRICFRIGDEDARTLSSGFSLFTPSDLMSLGVGQAVARIGRADHDFNLSCPMPARQGDEIQASHRIQILDRTRREFASDRTAVEKAIAATYERAPATAPKPATPSAPRSPASPAPAAKRPPTQAPTPTRSRLPHQAAADQSTSTCSL